VVDRDELLAGSTRQVAVRPRIVARWGATAAVLDLCLVRGRKDGEPGETRSAQTELKFPRPKILLVDLPQAAADGLTLAGYRVRSGTFGRPYRVPVGDGYRPVVEQATLPEYPEQEIVVVNLARPEPAEGPEGELTQSRGKPALWAPVDEGVIDPRPKVMWQVSDNFDRIYGHGGIFVVFVGPRSPGRYVLAHDAGKYNGLRIDAYEDSFASVDSWCFSSVLGKDYISVVRDAGNEISIAEEAGGIASFLQAHLRGARFEATIQSNWQTKGRWLALAHNKFEEPVAALITPAPETDQGLILLLPQVNEPGALLVDLLGSFLPTLAPRLFPHVEGAKWVLRSEYELTRVVRLKSEIDAVNRKAREEVDRLDAAIQEERTANGYLHELLIGTGDDLVAAVKTALQRLGFERVEDADVTKASADLREDLQIHDRSPLLLVEVKGISSLPSEADALQVTKYIAPRMKELKRLDVQGLTIINHQRNLPALERQNGQTFQPDVLTNATEHGFGLLTTWDLYRLARNTIIHGWSHEQVAPILFRTGRIEPVPEHFVPIGVVGDVWPQAAAVGIKLAPDASLSIGDTIAFEAKVDFAVERVTSIQVDNESVAEAVGGTYVGVKVGATGDLRDGTRVFLIQLSGDEEETA